MKVLHIAQMAKGGPASYLSEIVPYQIAVLGAESVRIVTPADQSRYFDPHLINNVKTLIPVHVPSRRSLWNLVRFLFHTLAIIRSEKPDILHLHSTYAGALVRLWYYLTFSQRPKIVYCAHGWAFNMRVSRLKRRMYAWFERQMIPVTDTIICISCYEYNEAVRNGIPPAKMRVIHNAIKDRLQTVNSSTQIYDPSTLNLLFIGRHDPQKGLDVLIEAMNLLRDQPITLHVVGEAVVSAERALASPKNVICHGWQDRSRIDNFIYGADALVMPSRWEGFGLVAIEAMRQGTPVCASAVDALPELVLEGVSGFLFPPENAKALADLLGKLTRPALEKMSYSTREWFLKNFTSDKLNQEILATYYEVSHNLS